VHSNGHCQTYGNTASDLKDIYTVTGLLVSKCNAIKWFS